MDVLIEKLHAAVRRYCIDRHKYWKQHYFSILDSSWDEVEARYSDEANVISSRFSIQRAILREVEGFIPENFSSLEEAREILIIAGQTANDHWTQPPSDTIGYDFIQQERELYTRYVKNISDTELSFVEPLFYRRVLTSKESRQIWSMLNIFWGIPLEFIWYPPEKRKRPDIEVFQDDSFVEQVGLDTLRSILISRGVDRLWELRDYPTGYEYEMETAVLVPDYGDEGEGYWSSNGMDWIIHSSHDECIVIGGWLLGELKETWTDWQQGLWTL